MSVATTVSQQANADGFYTTTAIAYSSPIVQELLYQIQNSIAGGGGGFPAAAKGKFHTSPGHAIVATGVPQLILNSDTNCYNAIIINDATSSKSVFVGGDTAGGDQPIEIAPGTAWNLPVPSGRWFNIHEMGIMGTMNDTYSVLFFTDP